MREYVGDLWNMVRGDPPKFLPALTSQFRVEGGGGASALATTLGTRWLATNAMATRGDTYGGGAASPGGISGVGRGSSGPGGRPNPVPEFPRPMPDEKDKFKTVYDPERSGVVQGVNAAFAIGKMPGVYDYWQHTFFQGAWLEDQKLWLTNLKDSRALTSGQRETASRELGKVSKLLFKQGPTASQPG
jgi:hypothetical protein